jgi:hypothetical protein
VTRGGGRIARSSREARRAALGAPLLLEAVVSHCRPPGGGSVWLDAAPNEGGLGETRVPAGAVTAEQARSQALLALNALLDPAFVAGFPAPPTPHPRRHHAAARLLLRALRVPFARHLRLRRVGWTGGTDGTAHAASLGECTGSTPARSAHSTACDARGRVRQGRRVWWQRGM